MKIIFDKQTGMLNIQFKEEPSTESAEIEPGIVVDYNAKALRPLTKEELEFLPKSANNYMTYTKWY